LSLGDWSTFNNKVSSVSASAPLSSSGGTTPNIAIPAATNSQNGYLSSGDWTTFNGKENVLSFTSPLQRSVNNISIPYANGSPFGGYITSSDWNTFNSKGNGTVTSISTSPPITGGPFTVSGTIGITQASTSSNGYLSSVDWNTFNNKVSSLWVGTSSLYFLGNVGIGTSSTTYPLTVSGSMTNGNGALYSKNISPTGTGIIGIGNNVTPSISTSGCGGQFFGSSTGVIGYATTSGYPNCGGTFQCGGSISYVGGFNSSGTMYKVTGTGSAGTIIKNDYNDEVNMFCPEAPEILLTDYGIGKLLGGKCHITLDPLLSKNIKVNEEYPLKVFIQVEGECNGVYVTNKTQIGFDVYELHGGLSNTPFSWTVVANRDNLKDDSGKVISNNLVRFPLMWNKKNKCKMKNLF